MNDVRNLYFINERGIPRLLATNVNNDTRRELIRKFLEHNDFKHYYTRMLDSNRNGYKGTWYDVGSHTEFFFWGVIEDVG